MRFLKVGLVLAALGAYPAAALAHKAPSKSQRTALTRAFDSYLHRAAPAHCLKFEVSTANSAWAEVEFGGVKQGKLVPSCAKFASNGEVIFHFRGGKWRYVTSGSSFENSNGVCGLTEVPKSVVADFKLCG